MDGLGPGDGPDRPGARAPVPGPLDGRLHHTGVGGEPEVVVAGEVDEPPATDLDLVPLGEFQHAERPVETLAPEAVQILVQRSVQRQDGLGSRVLSLMGSATPCHRDPT